MASHTSDEHWAVSPQELAKVVRDAYQFYKDNKVERYQSMALDLVRRYVVQEGMPRESDPFYGAALFIVTRHPWSHPNPLTKNEFAVKLRMKESSLEWYVDTIAEKLGFATLRDTARLPYYLDPEGTIASVVDAVVRGSVGERVVSALVTGDVVPPEELTEQIVDRLCNVVKIVPRGFEQGLAGMVRRKIDDVSRPLLNQLTGQ
ncbi:MAG: hypothetical protein ACTSV3_02825 [Candidatus Thorarchaeota archaeon]|nr:MAG: hypothetical protein DRP09_02805 [Candidatus Thorarchaeota archaeon]RLI58612.1 MAG: hypothetical protein DRO87_05190 [Candidatus Thorarchaeota archaeon]